jgi:hypothetical protein
MTESLSTPAREVFPEYATLFDAFEVEIRGLSDEVIDKRRPEHGWGGWSIREQVSHTARVPYLVLLEIWGEILFGGNLPLDKSVYMDSGRADRMMNPAHFPAMDDLLAALSGGFALGWDILERETLGSMREKVLPRRIDPRRKWANGERVRDYFETLVLPAHKIGIWRDEKDPDLFHQTLECAMRHILWEAFTHLKTIQLHKISEGLPTGPPAPEVGYTPLLNWD